ncbi:MAG: RluA family pseudouridine synthase [Candidatus Saccharimonadales bacterium]
MQQKFVADQTGERADSFLARAYPEYSRSSWQKLCQQGVVLLHDAPVKPSQTISEGDVITVLLPESPDFSTQTLPVLYEDDDVIVINKPAGVLTHAKGAFNPEFTVADFMRPQTTDGPESNRPGIVHRLDRETSGVLIAAKNNEAKRWLQRQFSLRKAKKTYLALVEGQPAENAAIIRLPIERNPKKPQTFRVGASGKPAETAYEVENYFRDYSLVRLKPLTGRTHQIRVHMHYLGCPIAGDALYGHKAKGLPRMFLHAAELEITLPSRERKTFSAPLPPELQKFLNSLQ